MRCWVLLTGLLLALTPLPAESREANDRIRLRSGSLLGPTHDAGLADGLRISVEQLAAGGGAALLKFDAPITPAARESLAASGARWIAPLGEKAALVIVPAGGIERIASTPGLAWAAPYHPGLRIAPEVAAVTAEEARAAIPITVRILADSDIAEVAARLGQLGLPVRSVSAGRPANPRTNERAGRIVLAPKPAQVVEHRESIAAWPEVLWIGYGPSYRLANDAGAWVTQSGLDADHRTPVFDHGLFGEGQVVAVADTGLDADMCFFEDPDLGLPPVNEGFGPGNPDPAQRKVSIVNFLWDGDNPSDPWTWDGHGHGTHVAGSVAGDRLSSPGQRDLADGMAPAAKLVIQDLGSDPGECGDLAVLDCGPSDLNLYFDQAYQQGARLHSNSWTFDDDGLFPVNLYNDPCEDADEFMWNHPDFLILFAAGNAGSGGVGDDDTVSSPSTAKNVISVGSTNHDAQAGRRAFSSSIGNTHDGRLKPDIFAPGAGVVSASNDFDVTTGNCGTIAQSGTSMATPTVAGLAALIREYFEKGYYPGGAPDAADGWTPSAALSRASLIASGTPLEAEPERPPHPKVGWGRVLLDDALFFPEDVLHLFVEDIQDLFGSPNDPASVREIEVLDGSEPLKVVVTWTDYPSNPVAAINLVNDLDLTVTSPGGTVYLGNVFSGGISSTGGSADRLNNVEAVRVEQPEAGTWTVSVSPYAVPQPPQGFALVVTGRVPVRGVALEKTALTLDDGVGGDADGILEPGEWVDLPLELRNTGDAEATNVGATVESLSPWVEVITSDTSLPDLPSGERAISTPTHARIRMTLDLPCTEPVELRFTYHADGYSRTETIGLPTGVESVFLLENFEGPTGWAHAPVESTASRGDWVIGDPVGTAYQPEDDVTPDPGVNCLYTAPNPTGNNWVENVDDGVVVARSGGYDLTGHPEARLRIWTWFFNDEPGGDPEDYFRLHIRENALSPDLLLLELDHHYLSRGWTRQDFRVADHLQPGSAVELRVAASDGWNTGAAIEAAIDEIAFWEPVCDSWDPAPKPVADLHVDRTGDDIHLRWGRPALDPQHGEVTDYRIYRSESGPTGFAMQAEFADSSQSLSWIDSAAATAGSPSLFAYEVISANAAGDGDVLP